MKTILKRGLAFLMVALLICIQCNGVALAEETEITVFITVSRHGEIVKSKDGEVVALLPVELAGKDTYTLDDVFMTTHDLYFEGGAESGYAAASGEWGMYVTKAWGDESGKFGYQINRGTESVTGLAHTVKDADVIELCIYKNAYPDTENYARFSTYKTSSYKGEQIVLLVEEASGYDDAWNMLFSPCANACITINGEATELFTDEEGKAVLSFDTCGTYIVSAQKTKELQEQSVPAITAPVCFVTVEAHDPVTVLRNIMGRCIENGVLQDANMLWFIADMAVYGQLYEETIWTDAEKQAYLDAVIAFADTARTPGDLSKAILALRALGYDAANVYNAAFEKLDIVSRLTKLVDAEDADATGAYTLPYVILALRQSDTYATDSQMEYLINTALSTKESWQNMEYGPDAAAPMLLALAPEYAENAAVTSAIDETCALIDSLQTDGGWIDSWGAAASTGLVIAGYSALGIDANEVKKNGNSLIDGLMTMCTQSLDGFLPIENSFSTEQGFRGLLAWQLLQTQKEKMLYDFSDMPMEEAHASWVQNCPVEFVVTPENATVTVEGATAALENKFDLPAGTYSYRVSKSGYSSEKGTIIVLLEDETEHIPKTITISLNKKPASFTNQNGGTISYTKTETVPKENQSAVKTEADKDKAAAEEEEEEEEEEEVKQTEPEKEIEEILFEDVPREAWYYAPVQYACRAGLMEGMGEGFAPDEKMTRAMLTCVLYRMENSPETADVTSFEDVKSDAWYSSAVSWAAEHGIIKGISPLAFAPDAVVSREQTAAILYRYAAYKNADVSLMADLSSYEDTEAISKYAVSAFTWAVGQDIINGETAKSLAPQKDTTRAQMATILMRFCENMRG